MSELIRQVYEIGRDNGREEGMENGRQEGEALKARTTARAMLAERLPIDMISRCTGLTQDEVSALQA